MIDGTRFCVCFASHLKHALIGRFTRCATSQSQQRTFHTFLAMIEVPMISPSGPSRKFVFFGPKRKWISNNFENKHSQNDTCITKPQAPLESNSRENFFSSRDATQQTRENLFEDKRWDSRVNVTMWFMYRETLLRLKYRFPTVSAF